MGASSIEGADVLLERHGRGSAQMIDNDIQSTFSLAEMCTRSENHTQYDEEWRCDFALTYCSRLVLEMCCKLQTCHHHHLLSALNFTARGGWGERLVMQSMRAL